MLFNTSYSFNFAFFIKSFNKGPVNTSNVHSVWMNGISLTCKTKHWLLNQLSDCSFCRPCGLGQILFYARTKQQAIAQTFMWLHSLAKDSLFSVFLFFDVFVFVVFMVMHWLIAFTVCQPVLVRHFCVVLCMHSQCLSLFLFLFYFFVFVVFTGLFLNLKPSVILFKKNDSVHWRTSSSLN